MAPTPVRGLTNFPLRKSAIKGDETEPLPFHADRPFVFAVIVRENGAILMLGVLTRPAQEAGT
jgi:serine protease inhibitor